MDKSVLFYCSYISANVGVPGIYQSIIANLSQSSGWSGELYGSDYENYYQFQWSCDGKEIEKKVVEKIDLAQPTVVVFSAFDPYLGIFKCMMKWRRLGCDVVFWNWGYHTKQQCRGSWSNGKTPKWLKYLATRVKKYTLMPLIDYYFISGDSEIEDSGLNPQKCVKMPMGRPQSAILDELDTMDHNSFNFSNDGVVYIGRGQWKEKGISSIVKYSKTEEGGRWNYRFLISSPDNDLDQKMDQSEADNLEWHFDVFGKDNLPWLQNSVALMTVNMNPTQIRVPYESLYVGTPIVVLREAFMDEFKKILDINGLNEAVQIISPDDFKQLSFEILEMLPESRRKLASIMQIVLNAQEFGQWFGSWLENPVAPASYYDYISNKIATEAG